jgi:hypothetical protein
MLRKTFNELIFSNKLNKAIAIALVAALVVSALFALKTSKAESETAQPPTAQPAVNQDPQQVDKTYLNDFRMGFMEGFEAGVLNLPYPEMSGRTSGYIDGFSQGYNDGRNQQAVLQGQLCGTRATVIPAHIAPRNQSATAISPTSHRSSLSPRPIDRGLSSTTRKMLLIGSGAALGAGIGAAVGGKKGAGIGAAIGGGTGTVMALTDKPRRAFNRQVRGKDVLVNTLIGAGAGAAVGGLAGGKRGALAGAAIGGSGGSLITVMTGRRP